MSEATLDRVPIAQAQASSGLSRSSFYKRLQHAGITPLKVGVSSYLTQEHLERLADCERWVQAGNKPEDFLASIGEALPSAGAPGALTVTQAQALAAAKSHPTHLALLSDLPEEAEESPDDLVRAEVEHLDALLSFLTKAARFGWCLPTSRVELLIGGRPRGSAWERYGFVFRAAGKHGQETSWRVERVC
jgi:hypothetical protein